MYILLIYGVKTVIGNKIIKYVKSFIILKIFFSMVLTV